MSIKKILRRLSFFCLGTLVVLGSFTMPGTTASAAATPFFNEQNLFTKETDGYTLYRIPGIVVTGNGTIITYCEARAGRGDRDPLDVMMRRSTDGGNTWQAKVKLADGVSTGESMNNPIMLAERNNGTVHLFYCRNYSQVYYRKSTDHGATWSAAVEMTSLFNGYKSEYNWVAIGTGPGHGIQLSSGRLLVPLWFAESETSGISAVSTIYSDDGGATWSRGEILRENTTTVSLNEPVAVELYNGSVMMNIRNSAADKVRAVTTSSNGISGWSSPVLDDELPCPTCFGSILRFTDQNSYHNNRILFSNINNPNERSNLTVRMSMDEGGSWRYSRVICAGKAAYSDLGVSNDKNTIYCFYERGAESLSDSEHYQNLTFARFNLEWLTNGEQSLDPLSGSAPTIPSVPAVNLDEHWNSLSAWTTGGSCTKEISPAGQLRLADNTNTGGHVQRTDLSIPEVYTLEYKAKIDDFTAESIGVNPFPASLGTKICDGNYRLMLDFRTDGIYAMTNFGVWTRVKAVTVNTNWRLWKVVVKHGVAEVFKDGVSQCKFAMHSGSYADTIQHWILGSSSDEVEAHVEYTRLYTGLPQSGPVANWRFNETSGATAADASPNGNTGTVSGAAWAAGYKNNGLSFDGADDYVDAGNKSSLQFNTDPFTAAAWVKTDTISSDRFIFWYGDVGADVPQWWVKLQSGNIAFLVDGNQNPSANSIATTNSPITTGVWKHVAVTRDGTLLKIYVNGVECASGNSSNIPYISSATNGLAIGRDKNGTTRYWDGMLDEVVLYDRALRASEITALYNN